MITLVLQGPVYPYTKGIVDHYLASSIVEEVIVSCWETCNTSSLVSDRVKIIKNKDPDFPGLGNINRHIVSSLSGLSASSSNYCAKMRTDQKISHDSLVKMDKFYNKFKDNEVEYLDKTGPTSPIFVVGMYKNYAFHPRDHVFWGNKSDLINLFNIPQCMHPIEVAGERYNSGESYWRKSLRPECYLGMHYCSKFDLRVSKFKDLYQDYVMDCGAHHSEALAVSREIQDKIFKVFPRIDMEWPKYHMKQYHYNNGAAMSEYWYEQDW
jgi:hypothetical protein